MVKPASSPHFSSHLPSGKLTVGLLKNQPFLVVSLVSLILQSLSGRVYVNLLERSIIFFQPFAVADFCWLTEAPPSGPLPETLRLAAVEAGVVNYALVN